MLKKYNKAARGPTWIEVILGAVLAAILGVALGAAFLVTKTVSKVRSIPKDAPAGAIYYIEGSTEMNRSGIADLKKSFVDGESVELSEGQLNGYFASVAKAAAAPAPAKPGDKNPPPAQQSSLDVSALNARIDGGKITFGDTVNLSVYGVATSFIVQATGAFARDGAQWVFEPETILVGGCPVQRIPFLKGLVMSKFLFAQPVPPDVAAAWSKLTDVSIIGSKLRLKAP